ncbi:energy transducer TonB family protein [Acidiphilium sp.]|uniref:energy transducer TonB family protein n=1 Tax=Acidiphilium sp. TaxID=527 RepID=UPI003CFC6E5A
MTRVGRWLPMIAMAISMAIAMPTGRAAPPGAHPIDAATQAAIARQVPLLLARHGVRYVGFYGFIVDRAGHVLNAWVVRPSGRASLDRLALAAIRRAVLKRRPAGAPASIQFVVPIEFRKNGDIVKPAT